MEFTTLNSKAFVSQESDLDRGYLLHGTGFDLKRDGDRKITHLLWKTGIIPHIPEGMLGLITPHSKTHTNGLAMQWGITFLDHNFDKEIIIPFKVLIDRPTNFFLYEPIAALTIIPHECRFVRTPEYKKKRTIWDCLFSKRK